MSHLETTIRQALRAQTVHAPSSTDVESTVLRNIATVSGAETRNGQMQHPLRVLLGSAFGVAGIIVGVLLLVQVTKTDNSSTASSPDPRVSTGTWRPGDPANEMAIQGRLMMAHNGCIHIQGSHGSKTDVLWPAGWSADRVDSTVTLRDADGRVVATLGQQLRMTGGGLMHKSLLGCHTPGAEGAVSVTGSVTIAK